MVSRLLQSEKAFAPIDVTPLGIVTLRRLSQPEKAFEPIDFTLLGIVMHMRPRQLSNADSPIEVTRTLFILDGISTEAFEPLNLFIITPAFEAVYSKSPKTAANPKVGRIVMSARMRDLSFISERPEFGLL